jgi:hypothetical protein
VFPLSSTFWTRSVFRFENHDFGHVPPGLSQTLWNCARHWDDGNGWPIMEHILKICFTVHTSYTSITCVHVQYKDAYLCVWYVIRHINAEQDVTIMCVCVPCACLYIYTLCIYMCTKFMRTYLQGCLLIWSTRCSLISGQWCLWPDDLRG